MMKKFGFTLAEVLITLGIVGVIAAMTIPTFVTNAQNKANAARLSSTISNLENAFGIMMVQEGANTFDETEFYEEFVTSPTSGKTMAKLDQYLKINGSGSFADYYEGTSINSIVKEIGNSDLNINHGSSDILYQTKNGAIIHFSKSIRTITEQKAEENGLSINSAKLILQIDVNGAEKPNLNGRDFFLFMLGPDGKLYPAGGKTYSYIIFGDDKYLYTNEDSRFACTGSKRSIGCTARLIENNFVVDY